MVGFQTVERRVQWTSVLHCLAGCLFLVFGASAGTPEYFSFVVNGKKIFGSRNRFWVVSPRPRESLEGGGGGGYSGPGTDVIVTESFWWGLGGSEGPEMTK